MNKEEALNLVFNGRHREWNSYRHHNPIWKPDLSDIDLSKVDLRHFFLNDANLCGATLPDIEKLRWTEYKPVGEHDWVSAGIDDDEDRKIYRYVNLGGAIIDTHTKFPSEYNPIDHGARYVSREQSESLKSNRQ